MRPAATQSGFTLVELLVALVVMAMLAVLSWQGLDGMTRAQERTRQRADEILSLQAGLGQWKADLDALVHLPSFNAIEWDGRGLSMVRLSSDPQAAGPLVVAWTRRNVDGTDQWLRWQSPPVRNRTELSQAWAQAALWAQNPGEEQRRREVAVTPLADWTLYYYRDGAWTNPQSSAASSVDPATGQAVDSAIPDGVRLVLTLPAGQALAGVLTQDWVRPTVGGGKS
ncbi:general secretion pathway protein J [Rhodoferax koreense]|uniref:General secretion pathway protein J n=1 Tax=Rhodoferax koreensis TaxID=1842727 RepID=A0A1P8JSS4_9BURK|nr:prepilin-type N-terminal cleavage/methylation domain-containing protein [Rhodoferax koreense]APW36812.1 general secretion pathway protein J [Rhodoferax koreense]